MLITTLALVIIALAGFVRAVAARCGIPARSGTAAHSGVHVHSGAPVPAVVLEPSSNHHRPDGATAEPDSLDLLLLALPRTRTLTLRGEALVVEGSLQGPRVVLTAQGDSVRTGDRARASIVVTARSPLTLETDSRKRVVSGTITIASRYGALVIVARIDRDQYLAGALMAEAKPTDPRSYLTALSVLQRNYLESHRRRHAPDADVCDNTHCQLFRGDQTPAVARAIVREAGGLALMADTALPSYYSATCGGATLTPGQVWGASEPGYAAVTCADCRNDRWYRWKRTVTASPTARMVLDRAPAAPFVDDNFKIRVGRALGFDVVPSNTVDRLELRGASYHIAGRGFGHRVGLCQAGARQMAKRGRTAREILARYFPTATLRTQ